MEDDDEGKGETFGRWGAGEFLKGALASHGPISNIDEKPERPGATYCVAFSLFDSTSSSTVVRIRDQLVPTFGSIISK